MENLLYNNYYIRAFLNKPYLVHIWGPIYENANKKRILYHKTNIDLHIFPDIDTAHNYNKKVKKQEAVNEHI